MKKIFVYDIEEEVLEQIASANNLTVAEVISFLADYIDDMKRDYNLI